MNRDEYCANIIKEYTQKINYAIEIGAKLIKREIEYDLWMYNGNLYIESELLKITETRYKSLKLIIKSRYGSCYE